MDWATFFRDNSQSLFTLLGVFLGSLITFVINYLNLRNQSEEHDKDRKEQRREATIQLALELKRNDIKIIEEAIDNSLKTLDIVENIRIKKDVGKITEAEMEEEIDSLTFDENNRFSHLGEQNLIDEKIAYSLGDEIYTAYKNFNTEFEKNLSYAANSSTFSVEDADKLEIRLLKSAAKLHNTLIEKLISIRDSEK